MNRIAFGLIAAGLAATAACSSGSTPKAPAAQPTTTTGDANHDGLVDGGYSLSDYCVTTAAGSAIRQGVAINRDVVAAKCAELIRSGTVKNTDDVDAAIAAIDWHSLTR